VPCPSVINTNVFAAALAAVALAVVLIVIVVETVWPALIGVGICVVSSFLERFVHQFALSVVSANIICSISSRSRLAVNVILKV
jgi:hypothetical protein